MYLLEVPQHQEQNLMLSRHKECEDLYLVLTLQILISSECLTKIWL